jgi:Tfp pilus assembly protein PilF
MRTATLTIALMIAVAGTALAQRAPRRPTLPPLSDTCDAWVYYQYGIAELSRDPEDAAAAFYWAQRLSPNTALAYYGERIALLMADPFILRHYVEGDRSALQSKDVRRIDSLQMRAMALDPFSPRRLDEELIVSYYNNRVRDNLRQQGEMSVSDPDIDAYVRSELKDVKGYLRAWLTSARGNYRDAADLWAIEARNDRKNTELRAEWAQALFLADAKDSARVVLDSALAAARRSDAQKMKYVYNSKAVWEYELGRIYELQGNDSAARNAYQQALIEDLSYHPAHTRLAYVALRAHDTTTAVTELERAVVIRDVDYSARLLLGTLHASRHAYDSAAAQLRRAIEIEPWVASPHLVLGDVRRDAGDRDGAVAEYRRFLALAALNDADQATARQRLSALGAQAQ